MLTFNDVQRMCRATRIVTQITVALGIIVFLDDAIQILVDSAPDDLPPSVLSFIKAIDAASSKAVHYDRLVDDNAAVSTCITLPNTEETRNVAYATLRHGGSLHGQLQHAVSLADLRTHLTRASEHQFVAVKVAHAELIMDIRKYARGTNVHLCSTDFGAPVTRDCAMLQLTASSMGLTFSRSLFGRMFLDNILPKTAIKFVTRALARLDVQCVQVTAQFYDTLQFDARAHNLRTALDFHI